MVLRNVSYDVVRVCLISVFIFQGSLSRSHRKVTVTYLSPSLFNTSFLEYVSERCGIIDFFPLQWMKVTTALWSYRIWFHMAKMNVSWCYLKVIFLLSINVKTFPKYVCKEKRFKLDISQYVRRKDKHPTYSFSV